jgi:DNA-binding SARP family transcriptional activator
MRFLRRLLRRRSHASLGGDSIVGLVRAIEHEPARETTYVQLLEMCETTGDIDAAISWLTTFVDGNSHIETPYQYLLLAYKRKGDLRGLAKLVEAHRGREQAHYWYLLNAYNEGDTDSAIVLLSKLVELHAGDERWCRYLIATYDRKGDHSTAIAGLEELLKIHPDNAMLCRSLQEWTEKSHAGTARGESPRSVEATRPEVGTIREDMGYAPESAPRERRSEFELHQELMKKVAKIDAKDRERTRVEHGFAFGRPRALTPREKFNRIRSRGSRDAGQE